MYINIKYNEIIVNAIFNKKYIHVYFIKIFIRLKIRYNSFIYSVTCLF